MTRPLITHAPRVIDIRVAEDRYGGWLVRIDTGSGFPHRFRSATIARVVENVTNTLMRIVGDQDRGRP